MHDVTILLIAMIAAQAIQAATRYVALDGGHEPPFTNGWASAATNIQLAVEACADGDAVLVSNGVYNSDSRAIPSYYSQNRVYITNAILLESLNGPAVTIIEGMGPLGNLAIRCVYMSTGVLAGFTLTNGHTRMSGTGNFYYYSRSGGGVNMYGGSGVISNCIIAGNNANYLGGGVLGGIVLDCVLRGNNAGSQGGGAHNSDVRNTVIIGNTAYSGGGVAQSSASNCLIAGCGGTEGGGAFSATLEACVIAGNSAFQGGGARESRLHNCIITNNRAKYGGGANSSWLSGCLIRGNDADESGGGTFGGSALNCTITGNSVTGEYGGGALGCGLTNCIIWGNAAPAGSNCYACDLAFSCSWPLPDGEGNTNADPLFVNAALGDYHLLDGSLCINTGTNLPWMAGALDLDGNPRIYGDSVDMGCYEAVPEPAMWGVLGVFTMCNLQCTIWWRRRAR